MVDDSRVLVGPIQEGYLVKVVGRGTMEFCSQLYEHLGVFLEKNSANHDLKIYFDMSETTYMDSSFIGVIVSIDKKIKRIKDSILIVLNPSDKVKEILNTMGLTGLIPLEENLSIENIKLSDEIQKKLAKDYDDIKLLLESHQNLMELSIENRKRFSLVEEMLKKELERNGNA